ncbi:FAD-binding oxidoreductase [Plantactinospora sp. KBS50]|uniref:FAD-binding oxidoreductase n=1 Tax=Plantactinospora sp. KBS50 TaxID=2024580 RepID=UPI0012FE0702|nr:FAD-binding protein [Plantactinospora sp. KBS50]
MPMPDVEEIGPRDAGWEPARALFDASLDRWPSVVWRPYTAEAARRLIRSLQGQGLPFTLKSGGHSAAGLSVADAVPMVDLSRLRAVRVDPGGRLAYVQAGALMRHLDRAAARFGLATTGGTVSHTGVVGLACGGGLGWLMGRFGLACDNIAQAQVVQGGRDLVVDESSALMTTLRGSGTSLGFISGLVLRLHPVGQRFRWRAADLSVAELTELLPGLSERVQALPAEAGCALTLRSTPEGHVTGLVEVVAPDDSLAAPQWCATLATPGRWSARTLSYLEVQRHLDAEFEFGSRSYRRSLSVDAVVPACIGEVVDILRAPTPFWRTLTFDVLHGRAMAERNISSSCVPRRRYAGIAVCRWAEPTLDALGRSAGRELFAVLDAGHREANPARYGNYSSEPADSRYPPP